MRASRGKPAPLCASVADRARLTVAISTNVSGEIAVAVHRADFLGLRCRFASAPSRHFHHSSDFGLMPNLAPNSFALSPLAFHLATRFAHVSRDVCPIVTSTMETYVGARHASGT